MNVKRFVGRNSHEALQRLKQALGPDAVVLSTRPCAEGVELLAMGPEAAGGRSAAEVSTDVQGDAQTLSMSTLSFQDYVRERMLRRRQESLAQNQTQTQTQNQDQNLNLNQTHPRAEGVSHPRGESRAPRRDEGRFPASEDARQDARRLATGSGGGDLYARAEQQIRRSTPRAASPQVPERLHSALMDVAQSLPAPRVADSGAARAAEAVAARTPTVAQDSALLLEELRSVKGLIEQRFGALAFLERMQRQPAQARLAQRLLEAGFSPALSRKITEMLPQDAGSEERWAAATLERNLRASEQVAALEDQGGVVALIGTTGVGKTTTTAKLAAAFAARHGAGSLGLITLDAYRIGAQEQLRAYGRILGVPVHSAHDRASLEDLLELLADKRMVLIDTAGIAQRDSRTREMLDMLAHPSIQRVLVLSAAAQGETLEDVVVSWRAAACKGVVLSKVDEAVRLAPALDVLIRHKLPVLGVANGQRVPEDWHRLTAQALVQRALRDGGRSHWRLDAQSVELIFTDVGQDIAAGHHAQTSPVVRSSGLSA